MFDRTLVSCKITDMADSAILLRCRMCLPDSQDSSDMTLSHFSSKIFTASVNSTSGGRAPVDSMVSSKEKQ